MMMRLPVRPAVAALCALLLVSCVTESAPSPSPVKSPPESDSPSAKTAENGPFVVTKDVYAQTFSEVQTLIASLNEIIRMKNYEAWLKALSPEYIAATDNAEFLRAASEEAALKSNHIVLKTLRDYFLYVVVPSRSLAVLSEISFIDADRVKAITIIDGTPVILYKLVKKNAKWMVGIW
jgi:hypothetical protein